MSENLTFIDVYGALNEAIPELRPLILSELGKYYDLPEEKPGEYPVFEDVLKPFLRECLERQGDSEVLMRLFRFLERMATSSDPGVVALLQIGVLESLAYDPFLYSLATAYMEPKTAQYASLHRREYEKRKILPT